MSPLIRTLSIAALTLLPLSAAFAGLDKPAGRCGIPGGTASPGFNQFMATHPTVEAFKGRYSCIWLVLPNTATTYENRSDNSRYFATVDEHGRIVGGRFG